MVFRRWGKGWETGRWIGYSIADVSSAMVSASLLLRVCAADACAFFGRNGAILLFRSPPDDLVGNYRFSTDWLVK